jgi:hypothetical protein
MRTLLSALILSLGAIVSAQAEELSAATGANIKLGPVNGVAYYTVADDGYRVGWQRSRRASGACRFGFARLLPRRSA